jgi:hypothetical protein
MCVNYENINILFYDVWVCENCGYAALQDKFEGLFTKDIKVIKENISSHWTQRSFTGERDVNHAIEAFKLALLNLKVRNAKSSEVAKVCLRIAWLYRFKQDEEEIKFLNFALKAYTDAYQNERFPLDRLDENTCMYIIAELYRRVGNYEEAIQSSTMRLQPLTCYYHEDLRPDKFGGTALTGVQVYMGYDLPELTGSVVFTDLARDEDSPPPVKGALAYTRVRADGKPNEYSVIETDYDFKTSSAYYVSLGTNIDQSRLFLGVYGSMKVAEYNLGTVFEIIPV